MVKKAGYLVVSKIMLSAAASHAEIIASGSTTVQRLAEIWASKFNRKINSSDARYLAFDYLRAFSVLAVVAWHTKLLGPVDGNILYFNILLLAVPILFQVALFLYLQNRSAKEDYFRKRLKRLSILYFSWTLISALILGTGILSKSTLLRFLVTGAYSPAYFIFSLIILTIVTEMMIHFKREKDIRLHCFVIIAFSVIFMFCADIAKDFDNNTLQALLMAFYSPFNFIPFVSSTFILLGLTQLNLSTRNN